MYRNPVDQIVNAAVNGILDAAEATEYVRKFADAALADAAQTLKEKQAYYRHEYPGAPEQS